MTWKPAGLPPPFLARAVFSERQEVRCYAEWWWGWENTDEVLSITFAKGKCSTNAENRLQGYNPFRRTSENRKSMQCLINLLQTDFPWRSPWNVPRWEVVQCTAGEPRKAANGQWYHRPFFVLLGVGEGMVSALWPDCTGFAHLL